MASASRCAYSVVAAAVTPKRTLRLRNAASLVPARASNSPILDFLLPSFALRSFGTAAPATAAQTLRAQTHPRKRQQHKEPLSSGWRTAASSSTISTAFGRSTAWSLPTQQRCRYFSTTDRRANTRTLLNPQMDDDGNEMRLEITSRAAKRLSKVMAKDGNPRLALRIQVESGGCHGFQYVMSLVTLPDQFPTDHKSQSTDADAEASVIRDDDTIFAFEGDEVEATDPLSAPKIILDTPSLELLNGSKVDFTMELIGSQFKIVDNPLASSSCGCGTSFDIKV